MGRGRTHAHLQRFLGQDGGKYGCRDGRAGASPSDPQAGQDDSDGDWQRSATSTLSTVQYANWLSTALTESVDDDMAFTQSTGVLCTGIEA